MSQTLKQTARRRAAQQFQRRRAEHLAREARIRDLVVEATTAILERERVAKGVVEVEAESFAHVVAADYGLDASSASFGYLAGWAASAAQQRQCTPEDVVLETAERVRHAIVDYLTHRNPEGTTSAAVEAYARALHREVDRSIRQPPARQSGRVLSAPLRQLASRPSATATHGRVSP